MPGWPTSADLAARLGLDPADDAANVAAANDAAIADAIAICGLDATAGTEDAGEWDAVLMLGQWCYQSRNRPEGLDSLNPVATPYYRRTALGRLMARTGMPIA